MLVDVQLIRKLFKKQKQKQTTNKKFSCWAITGVVQPRWWVVPAKDNLTGLLSAKFSKKLSWKPGAEAAFL